MVGAAFIVFLNLQLSMPFSITASYLLISSSYSAQFTKKTLKIFCTYLNAAQGSTSVGFCARLPYVPPSAPGPVIFWYS